MRQGRNIENSLGECIGFEFENGFRFIGEFNNKQPFLGDIFNSAEEIIYHGQITGDIHDYFIEYIETGVIKQRPITPL